LFEKGGGAKSVESGSGCLIWRISNNKLKKGDLIMKKLHVMAVAAIFILGALLFPTLASAEFEYAGPPAFTVDIGDDAVKGEVNADAGEVWKGKIGGADTYILVYDVPKDISAKDQCKSTIAGFVSSFDHLSADDVELLENKEFELGDGTMSWRCDFEWIWTDGSTVLTTVNITADKDGKRVQLYTTVHDFLPDAEVPVEVVESLEFE
jgi:hypothetical protein